LTTDDSRGGDRGNDTSELAGSPERPSFSSYDRRPRLDQDPLLIEAGSALSSVPICTNPTSLSSPLIPPPRVRRGLL